MVFNTIKRATSAAMSALANSLSGYDSSKADLRDHSTIIHNTNNEVTFKKDIYKEPCTSRVQTITPKTKAFSNYVERYYRLVIFLTCAYYLTIRPFVKRISAAEQSKKVTKKSEQYGPTNDKATIKTADKTKTHDGKLLQATIKTADETNNNDVQATIKTADETNNDDVATIKTADETNNNDVETIQKADETNNNDVETIQKADEKKKHDVATIKTADETNNNDVKLLQETIQKADESKTHDVETIPKADRTKPHNVETIQKADEIKTHNGETIRKAAKTKTHNGATIETADETNNNDVETIQKADESKNHKAIKAKAKNLAEKCVEKLDKILPCLQKYRSIRSNASIVKNEEEKNKKKFVVDEDQGFVDLDMTDGVVESRFGSITRGVSISDFFKVAKDLTFAKNEDDTVNHKGDVRQSKTEQNLYSASFVLNKIGLPIIPAGTLASMSQANLTFKILDNRKNEIINRDNGKNPDYIIYGDGDGVATEAHEESYKEPHSQVIDSLIILIYTSEDGQSYEMNGICRTNYNKHNWFMRKTIDHFKDSFGKIVFQNVMKDIEREVKREADKNQPKDKQKG